MVICLLILPELAPQHFGFPPFCARRFGRSQFSGGGIRHRWWMAMVGFLVSSPLPTDRRTRAAICLTTQRGLSAAPSSIAGTPPLGPPKQMPHPLPQLFKNFNVVCDIIRWKFGSGYFKPPTQIPHPPIAVLCKVWYFIVVVFGVNSEFFCGGGGSPRQQGFGQVGLIFFAMEAWTGGK